MVTDDHFAIYTKIKSLCCIPEASIMLCVNYTSVIKKKENWAGSREANETQNKQKKGNNKDQGRNQQKRKQKRERINKAKMWFFKEINKVVNLQLD